MISLRPTINAASDWSRRHFLVNFSKLLLVTGLLPCRNLFAQAQADIPHSVSLAILVDALLPADELTPAASTLNVHLLILKEAEQDPSLQQLIDEGLQWLAQSVGPLALLDAAQIDRLLQAMSDAGWDTGPKHFFYQLRDRTVSHYYANPLAWAGSAINRPPQPLGYPELSQSIK